MNKNDKIKRDVIYKNSAASWEDDDFEQDDYREARRQRDLKTKKEASGKNKYSSQR